MDINDTAVLIHQTARNHGFWDKERNLGEMLMLVTSELAECLEEDRNHKPHVYFMCPVCGYVADVPLQPGSRHYIPVDPEGVIRRIMSYFDLHHWSEVPCEYKGPLKPEGSVVELIDAIIRLLDTSQHLASMTKYSISDIMAMKMRYNEQRAHMHGKAY